MRALTTIVISLIVALAAAPARAQEVEALKREIEQMRQQLEALTRRLQAIESQPSGQSPPAAPPAPAAPVAPSAPAASPAAPPTARPGDPASAAPTVATGPTTLEPGRPSLLELARPREPFALYQQQRGGSQLLFDIGVAGDFIGDFGARTSSAYQPLATFPDQLQRFFPREVEIGLYGAVDPYARAYIVIEAGEEFDPASRTSEFNIELAEAALTVTALPWGFQDKLGLMRVRYGLLNEYHDHDLPQPDRPAVLVNFFGQEGLRESGNELSWVPDLPFYLEGIFGIFNGDNETAFGSASFRQPLFTGRLRTFLDLGDWGALQLGASVAAGTTSQGLSDTILGFDAKYKFTPDGWRYPLLTVGGEFLQAWRYNEVTTISLDPSAGETTTITGKKKTTPFGYYVWAEVQPWRRWSGGLRYDNSGFLGFSGRQWAIEPYIALRLSEFLRFRLAYRHTYFDAQASAGLGGPPGAQTMDEVLFQATFFLGAHPAHRF